MSSNKEKENKTISFEMETQPCKKEGTLKFEVQELPGVIMSISYIIEVPRNTYNITPKVKILKKGDVLIKTPHFKILETRTPGSFMDDKERKNTLKTISCFIETIKSGVFDKKGKITKNKIALAIYQHAFYYKKALNLARQTINKKFRKSEKSLLIEYKILNSLFQTIKKGTFEK